MRRNLFLIILPILIAVVAIVGVNWDRNPLISLDQGLRAVQRGDAAAVDQIERHLSATGRTDEATVLRCSWLYRRGAYQEVLKRLPQQLLKGPLRRHVLRLSGQSLYHVGLRPQSELLLATLTKEFPEELEAHRLLAVLFYDVGANNAALHELAEVERLAPADYRPNHLAGVIYADGEDYKLAIEQFQRGLTKHPPEAVQRDIQRELVKSLMRHRDYKSAISLLTEGPVTDEIRPLLAECYWSVGNKEQAGQLVESSLERNPADTATLKLKATMLEDAGDFLQAADVLRIVLKSEPFDVPSRYQFVQLLGLSGQTDERDREQIEYDRLNALQQRLVEFNLKASEEPNAEEPRRELADICRQLGRVQLADMWQRAADYCQQRRATQLESPQDKR